MKHLITVMFAVAALIQGTAEAKVQVSLIKRVSTDKFSFGVGSGVRINFGSSRAAVDGIFLGRVVEADGHSDEYLFLDTQKTRAYLVDRSNTVFVQNPGKPQTVLRPMDQYGGTCAAFAFTHYWQQYFLGLNPGNETLQTMMSSERERTKFLEENVSHYYLGRPIEIATIMKQYGKRFGASCKTVKFTAGSVAADFVYNYAKAGIPVLIDFNIGPNMLTSTYETVDFEKPGSIDSRLWIPRKTGERNSGGHAVVAAAGFTAHGRRKLIMIDSDWDQPRIWDIDRYLGERTAIKEMGFTVCGK
ncbi:MAG: hypothetical protein JST80_02530 [Bdellovibrionales bacterium]|nr:hypothetical protein [Bdellovibrionales bacterium]